jgi:transcriptional regulator with PAS, ATPase and Fis domain
MASDDAANCTLTSLDQGRSLKLPSIHIAVTPPDKRVIAAPLDLRPLVIGTSAECDLPVADPRISRKHCELRITERGVALRDLGSKNGTFIRGIPIIEVILPPAVPVTLGNSELVILPVGAPTILPLASGTSFGDAIGHSLTMRALFGKLERASPSDETILLLGESGTGKEVLAKAIHANSLRHEGPFVVFDCGAVAPSLVEAELFGYMRGAFTGAAASQPGLLELASGGTLFIDEIGELPLELQPKLLRALESRQIRRLGATDYRPFDARVLAATHRNLKAKIAEGSFREDLYYRLAVVEVHVPALRERKEDIPPLVERFLASRSPPRTLADLPPSTLSLLQAHDWPGNVRELRNTVARTIMFPELVEELFGSGGPRSSHRPESSGAAIGVEDRLDVEARRLGGLLELQLPEAREVVLERLERSYVAIKLRQHGGNVSRAADAMGISRQLAHRLIDRYELRARPRGSGDGD